MRAQRTVKRQDMSKGKYGHDGLTQTYTDPADGTVYIWDREKNAWFPKVNYKINICVPFPSVIYCVVSSHIAPDRKGTSPLNFRIFNGPYST